MKKTTIGIDGRGALLYRGTGIGTYTRQLLSHLEKEHCEKEDFHFLLPGQEYRNYSFSAEEGEAPAVNGDYWRQHFLPKYIQENRLDLYHVPQNGIGLPAEKCCKETVTIHDLIPYVFPETVGKGYLKEFLKEMPAIISRSDGIIAVSHWTKQDIIRIFGVPEKKIRVIYEAPEPIYRPLPKAEVKKFLEQRYGIVGSYLLYVGGFSLRKNVKLLFNAFYLLNKEAETEYKLILPGRREREGEAMDALIEGLNLDDKVIFVNHIPGEELPFFYNGATALIYPSLYEGFGLPPLEAMACGTPVLAAKCTSLPEVLGDAALWFSPYHSLDLAEQLHRIISSPSLRELLKEKGKKKAADYTWQRAAEETRSFFSEVLSK